MPEQKKFKYPESVHVRALLQKIKLEEFMTQNVICIHEDERFSHVEDKFHEFRIRHLPIINSQKKIVGIITEKDLYRIRSPRKLEDGSWYYDREILDTYILKNVMTKNPSTLTPEHTLGDALLKIIHGDYGCIPIVSKEGVLCGIVTKGDLLRMAARTLAG